MNDILNQAMSLYALDGLEMRLVSGHEGGRNQVYICRDGADNRFVLRASALGDRSEEDYLAEAEFVRYLARNGAPVADVIDSARGRLVERVERNGGACFLCLFEYAKGMLISDNGYRYRDGAPLEEYFVNTGRALGAIHRLSRQYRPVHRRPAYFDKFSMASIDRLIPDGYAELKRAIARRLEAFRSLPTDADSYGLIHFDFSDGNYHVDMDTGAITAFDFDNCLYGWYMYDLANLWTHGVGWCRFEPDGARRLAFMERYFGAVLEGYRRETDVPDALLNKLPLFIDMVLIENVVDEFECCARAGEAVDDEDIEDAAGCLIDNIPWAGVGLNPSEPRPES